MPVSRKVAASLVTRFLDSTKPSESARPMHIQITVPADASRLSINVWDRFGDHVRRLSDEARPSSGRRTIDWDVTNGAGESLGPGYYIVRVTVDDRSESKIVWIKE
jgi:flagellar hook assembly protein FlgD